MNPAPDTIGKTGLQFFGTMTASISHEIKNVLAIINENAGLMKDLALMAEQGRPLNLDKVKTIADRFGQQVKRADHIVKNLNQFSHSIDAAAKQVDVCEALALVIGLANRFIAMKNVSVDFKQPDTAHTVYTNPFFLNNLLWFCLECALDLAGKDKNITIECKNEETCCAILISGLSGLAADTDNHPLFSNSGDAIIHYLAATIDINEKSDSFIVRLPHELQAQGQ